MDKETMRLEIAAKRDMLASSQVESLSNRICATILDMPEVKDSKSVGIYISFRNEVLAEKLLDLLSYRGKKVFVPVVYSDDIKFARLGSLDETVVGANGMRQPVSKSFAKDGSIGAFVVPGLAFDLRGFRVGWGKGHYDKFLSRNKDAVKIGATYDFQVVERIEAADHDVRMNFVVTEKRVLKF